MKNIEFKIIISECVYCIFSVGQVKPCVRKLFYLEINDLI